MAEEIFSALASKTRLEILQILSDEPKNVKEVLKELNERNFSILYRESVYRALEKLKNADLVEKYYDEGKKSIVYKIKAEKVEYIFSSKKISFVI